MTNEIILSIENNEPVVSSRQIAESFEKNHRDVLRAVDCLKKDVRNFAQMFFETETPDSYGRPQRTYLMNRDGFSLLVMGFTGKAALEWKIKYIEAFNAMEKKLAQPREMSRSELISRALIAANEEINELTTQNALLTEKNEEMTPKAEYYDELVACDSLMTLTNTAKMLKLKPKFFTERLTELKFLYRRSDHGPLVPYESTNIGYFEVKNRKSTKTDWSGLQTYTTVTGRQKFLELKNRGFFDPDCEALRKVRTRKNG